MISLNDQEVHWYIFLALKSRKFTSDWKADISSVSSIEK